MHNNVASRIPSVRISALLDRLSGSNQPRFCKSLHACLRNVGDGRKQSEPQKDRREQELGSEAILLQQCTRKILVFQFWTTSDSITESSLYVLRHERTLLYRPLPPFFLLSSALFCPPSAPRITIYLAIKITSTSKTIDSFHKPMVGRGYGDGSVSLTFPFGSSRRQLTKLHRANKLDSTGPWILAAISFPVMFGKQVINLVQLVKASRWLAEGDVAERRKRRASKKI